MKAGALATLILLAASCAPMVARAQTPSTPRQASSLAASHPDENQQQGPPAQQTAATGQEAMTPEQVEEMHGDIFMARKMFSEAIQTYQDLLLADPKNAKVLNKAGICYQQLGDVKQAERYYKNSFKADKTFASPLNNLGTLEFGKHKYKGAIKDYKKAIKVDPTLATTFSNLGYAYLARKKVKDAILSFRQAILLNPNVFQDRAEEGSVVEQRGNMDQGFYYYTLAKTFAMLGDAERCAHYLTMARDEGYKKYTDARKDPVFKPVLKDPRIQLILAPPTTDTASNP